VSLLPNAEHAFLDIRKIRDYLLDPLHPRGRHKARVFRAALGITANDAEWLREQLLSAAKTTDARFTHRDEFGDRYEFDVTLVGLDRDVPIRTSWIVLRSETFPRFVGCYIL
jgi:hypothetical protein